MAQEVMFIKDFVYVGVKLALMINAHNDIFLGMFFSVMFSEPFSIDGNDIRLMKFHS